MMCGGVPAALAVAAAAVAIWFALTAPFAETVVRRLYPGPPHCDATGCLSFPMDWAGPRDWSGHMTPTSATGTVALATDGPAAPYVITVRDDDLNDLTHRLERYRGPGAPLPRPPGDWGSGMPAEEVARLVEVWRTTYDWRVHEKELNVGLFAAKLDGLRVVFKHLTPPTPASRAAGGKAEAPNRPAVLLIHGWPGSIVEFTELSKLLLADGHAVVVPCLPGYGFSDAPAVEGYDAIEAARTLVKLMDTLGHTRFMIQGGDWGALIAEAIAHVAPDRVVGVHTNFPQAQLPLTLLTAIKVGIFDGELDRRRLSQSMEIPAVLDMTGYMLQQATRPETVGHAFADSPAGLLAWIVDKFHDWSGKSLRQFDDTVLLTNVMIYWVTNSYTSSARFYKENMGTTAARMPRMCSGEIPWPAQVPVAAAIFPHEMFPPPTRYVMEKFNTTLVEIMRDGGHFAAQENPAAVFRSFKNFADALL